MDEEDESFKKIEINNYFNKALASRKVQLEEEKPLKCACEDKPKILIVDDNIFNIITLETILQKQFGQLTDKATNG